MGMQSHHMPVFEGALALASASSTQVVLLKPSCLGRNPDLQVKDLDFKGLAQWRECLQCKYEDLSSDLEHPEKARHGCNPSLGV